MQDIEHVVRTLKEVVAKYSDKIKLAFLFGSVVEGKSGPLSDIDIGIVPREKVDLFDLVTSLVIDVAEALNVREDKVDVVVLDLEESPIELVYKAACHGIPLYYSSKEELHDFRTLAFSMYADFQVFLKKHRLVEQYLQKKLGDAFG